MLKLTPSAVVVYASANYGDFRLIQGNRDFDEQKIKRIKEAIASGIDVLMYCPILVRNVQGQHLEILDGQHRFMVAKELKRPVHFIIASKNMDMYAIASVNSNTSRWKAADYINCYSRLGNTHYEKLDQFLQSYKMPIAVSLYLLSKGKVNSDGGYSDRSKSFERGRFTVERWDDAVKVAESCLLFRPFSGCMKRDFIIAISKIIEAGKVPVEELATKVQPHLSNLEECANYKQYLNQLGQLYNKRSQSFKPIY